MKKISLIIAALLAGGLWGSIASAQEIKTFQYEDAIQVNGRAEKKVTPDEIFVAITVKDTDNKSLGVEGLEARMKREFAALGIDVDSALKVTSMANAPRRRNQVESSRSYELKVGDTRVLGAVFESLGEMGVSDAGVSRLAHSRIEELRSEVRVEAIRNARKIAAELAQALDQSILQAVWIQDNGFYENMPAPMYRTRAGAMDVAYIRGVTESDAPALEMQTITLTYNVTAKFVLRHR
jgi:uncharacterized protein YggE